MNLFEIVKANVSVPEAAGAYGLTVTRHSMTRCPFHDDRHPSLKILIPASGPLDSSGGVCHYCGARPLFEPYDVFSSIQRVYTEFFRLGPGVYIKYAFAIGGQKEERRRLHG